MNRCYVVDNNAGILSYEKSVFDIFKDRINRAMEDNKPISFKIAVGFFFFEGFQRLYPELRKLYEKGLLKEFKLVMGPETRKTTKEILEALKNDATVLNDETFSFIKKLYDEKKFDFRIFLERNFHIKLYLFEIGNEIEIWAGSANLTEAGLEENIELIVPTAALTFEDKDIYRKFFEEIWKRSTDEVEKLKVIDILKDASTEKYLYLSPREFFAYLIKILGKERLLENIGVEIEYLGKFQRVCIDLIIDRMEKYGGCILANSVGLGKTDIACAIIKYYTDKGNRVLLIIPPVLKTHWKRTLEKAGANMSHIEILSHGILQKSNFVCENYQDYDLIVVDEAHHFRAPKSGIRAKSNRRKNLEEITKINGNAHVLLISATPINISLADLTSLIRLFEKGKYVRVFEEESLSKYIKYIEKRKRDIDKEVIEMLRILSEIFIIRFDWLDIITHFKEDLKRIAGIENVELPDVNKVEFQYDKEIAEKIFGSIVSFLEKLNFEYAKLWEEGYKEDKNLTWWYRWRLYKRLESSLYAFEKSLENMKKRNEYLLKILSKNAQHTPQTKLFPRDRLERIIRTFNSQNRTDQRKIIQNIEEDIKTINTMLENVKKIMKKKKDEKLMKLLTIINEEKRPMLIFSESKDTVEYIFKFLKKNGVDKVIPVHGSESEEDFIGDVRSSVDKNKDKVREEFEQGKYDIIVTTDVLSEGVNLPRADIVVNFDLPYNPVRLIQRDGRALRLNNPKKIKIYNFVPDKSIDKELELFERLKTRVELILAVVGLDFAIWTIEEKKLKEFSESHRKKAIKLVREWKEMLATKTPEELKSKVISSVSKENKILKDFAEFFNISPETLEKYNRTFRKPVYTCLKSEKEGYWVVFEDKGYLFAGELQPVEMYKGEAKEKLTEDDWKTIESLVEKEIRKRSLEVLKTPSEKDRVSKEIEKLLGKHLPGLLPKFNPKLFSHKEKEEILKKLKECEKCSPWKRDKNLKDIETVLSKRTVQKQSTKTPKIIAVIKYARG